MKIARTGFLFIVALLLLAFAHGKFVGTVVTRNITTYGATCDGSGTHDDSTAFAAFQTANKNLGPNVQVQLTINPGSKCCFLQNGAGIAFAYQIQNLVVIGTGAEITDTCMGMSGTGGFDLGQQGICSVGLSEMTGCSARTASVSAGASQVTLLNTSLCSRFVTGRWANMTGYDLQGVWATPYGFPPNLHFFEYVKIADTSLCATTGVISFTTNLRNSYLSTWPSYNSGDLFNADPGGPATLYALDASWDATTEYQGLTISRPAANTGVNAIGRSMTFRNVTMTGGFGVFASQNQTWQAIGSNCLSCDDEIDKLIENIIFDSSHWNVVHFQSSSTDTLTVRNSSIIDSLNGTPKVAVISDSTIGDLKPGVSAYGRSDSVSCTNCIITNLLLGGYVETGPASVGANNTYTMTGGVIKVANGTLISAVADNGSGKVRMTVAASGGLTTGKSYAVNITTSGGVPVYSTPTSVTVIDGTHVDLPTVNYSATMALGCLACSGGEAVRAFVPNTNLFWGGAYETETGFHVVSVTQDAVNTFVQTSLAGGIPAVPADTGKINIRVHPAPSFTCVNCTGNADVVDLSQAGAQGQPLYSYSKRTYTQATLTSSAAPYKLWGTVTSYGVNVTTAYAGTGALALHATGQFDNYPTIKHDYSAGFYGPNYNLKAAGNRVTTSTSTPAGAQSGDSALGFQETAPNPWFTQYVTPFVSADVSALGTFSVTIEVTTNQNVVSP